MKKYLFKLVFKVFALAFVLLISSCADEFPEADAYGNFEAKTVLVSAEVQGTLAQLNISEGAILEKDSLAGLIDISDAVIKRNQLLARMQVIQANIANIDMQVAVQAAQRDNLSREVERAANLLIDNAATQQQYDDLTGRLNVQELQIDALESQKDIINAERLVLQEQIAEADNLVDKCRIINPVRGTVLELFAEEGELLAPGRAVYKIANLEDMELKFYVSGSQLASVVPGDSVTVGIDTDGGDIRTYSGVITWVSSEVEFTPKIIQTREERVNMVYAVKLMVKNDGALKIGMPGEVYFNF